MKPLSALLLVSAIVAAPPLPGQASFQPYLAQGENLIHVTTADFDGVGARDYVVAMTVDGKVTAFNRPATISDPSADNRLWDYQPPTSFGIMIEAGEASPDPLPETRGTLAPASRRSEPDQSIPYKQVGDVELKLHVFNPPGHTASSKTPALVLFHGGSWKSGGFSQFSKQCTHLADRGMVAVTVQYRTEKGHGTTPQECVKDAKSAMRWIRGHADELGIDPDRIAAGGGSAGGHMAAATALLEGFNEEGEDRTVSCVPDALVLFNPVADNGPGGFRHEDVKAYWEAFSPLHNIHKGAPPTLIMLGSEDNLFKLPRAREYKRQMESFGRRCDLLVYEGEKHAFFNTGEMYEQTLLAADAFLVSLGYLEPGN